MPTNESTSLSIYIIERQPQQSIASKSTAKSNAYLRVTIRNGQSKLACDSLLWNDTRAGPTAAVERGPSEARAPGARDLHGCRSSLFHRGSSENTENHWKRLFTLMVGWHAVSFLASSSFPWRAVYLGSHCAQLSHPPTHWQIFLPALPSDCFAIDFPGPASSPSEGLSILYISM
jgi:hypothetical protein